MLKIFLAGWFFIVFVSSALATKSVDCAYPALADHELRDFKKCGVVDATGQLVIRPDLIPKVEWSKFGMSCIFVHGNRAVTTGWYFVGQEGRGLPASFGWDNDCTTFKEGLAQGKVKTASKGRLVFYDRTFKITISTDYNWTDGFLQGAALVCKNVKKVYPPRNPKYPGASELFALKGGKCGYIDKSGKLVVPLNTPYEKLRKMARPKAK